MSDKLERFSVQTGDSEMRVAKVEKGKKGKKEKKTTKEHKRNKKKHCQIVNDNRVI